jgi:hypothetical protein
MQLHDDQGNSYEVVDKIFYEGDKPPRLMEEGIMFIRPLPKRWRAEKDGKYFHLDACMGVAYLRDNGSPVDYRYYAAYNYFQTEEQAKAAAEKIKKLLKNLSEGKE